MISKQALQEFKAIYELEIGPSPSDEILVAFACDLLNLTNVTYRPIKKTWIEDNAKMLPQEQQYMGETGKFQNNNSPRETLISD